MGFYEETGILILGTRLKRLSERFLTEVGKIYEELDIDFEPAWFPLIFLLHSRGPISITEIAEELKVSQPGASQLVAALTRKGWLKLVVDKKDKRRKIVNFSSKGKEMLLALVPVWETMERNMIEMFDGVEGSEQVVEKFNELESKLHKLSFGVSVVEELKK